MEIELSKQAFHDAWEHFNLGGKPIKLNVLPEGFWDDERRAQRQRAEEELHRLGLHDRDRSDDLYGLFVPLHRYDRAFDMVYRFFADGVEKRHTAMVASSRLAATLAIQREESVRLVRVSPEAMARALLGCLPEVRPGPGKSVSLRSAPLDAASAAAAESGEGMSEALLRQGVRRADARTLADMVGNEHSGFVQFGASRMDNLGNRSRAEMVTNCFAAPRGWYLVEETHRSGEPWTTIAPVDKTSMERRVQQLVKTFPRW